MAKWSLNLIYETFQKLHLQLHSEGNQLKSLNYKNVKKIAPDLISAFEARGFSWSEVMIASGINPQCHTHHFSYGASQEERKRTFAALIGQLAIECGLETLNDNSMNKSNTVGIPEQLRLKGDFHQCDRLGCEELRLSRRSIYAQGRRLFGTWPEALEFCEIDYIAEVRRKPSELTALEIIQQFDSWDYSRNSDWIISDIRDDAKALEKAIRNSFSNKNRALPFSSLHTNQIFIAWVNLQYYRKFNRLFEDLNWWASHHSALHEEFSNKHEGQMRWTAEALVEGLHEVYSRGPDKLRLTRESAINAPESPFRTLWSGLRQARFRDAGKTERDWLEEAGFLPKQLAALYKELDEPFTLRQLAKEFAKLMAESIENRENRLTREWVSENQPEFHNYLINRFGSWEKALRKFGLDPKFFQITASKRAKRGYQFQTFFFELLQRYGLEEVKESPELNQFVSNKFIPGCLHRPKCKPDFLFQNIIIDTKTGYHVSQKPDQILRYKSHVGRLLILTLKGPMRIEKVEDQELEIVGFGDFVKLSKELIGVEILPKENQELTKILKRSPFWS
ncbi:hypothetical protein AB8878_04360 [Alphaproteobacteria bacterium LSUCC0226]